MDTASPAYYSRLFLVPKPDGSFRPIIDLEKLNQFIVVPAFKMETLFSIITALQPQEWINKIDLKDAYHHILVHVNIWKYFRFVVAGVVYQFRVLPFGLSMAPREFTKTLAPVVQLLRTQGIRVHAYLDDWIIRANSQKQSLEHTQQTFQLLQSLGWTINSNTSMLQPSHFLDFLGLHFNLERAPISLRTLSYQLSPVSYPVCLHQRSCLLAKFHPSAGCHILPPVPTQWPSSPTLSPVLVQSPVVAPSVVVGYTNPVGCGLPHLPSLVSQTKCDDRRSVTSSGTQPVLLYGCIPDGMGRQLERPSDIRTMAAPESQRHFNWLELEAIRLALLHWGLQWCRQSVRVYCENSTAVAYICKQGGTHSQSLFYKTLELFDLLDQFVITLPKIQKSRGTTVIMTASQHPSRPWHPLLLQLSIRPRILLPDDYLFQYVPYFRCPQYHRDPRLLDLATWNYQGRLEKPSFPRHCRRYGCEPPPGFLR